MESLKIKVDVKRRTTENINLQQGYTYPIELTILDNGKEYDCTGATPQIHFAKSNGTFNIKTKDITIEGNKVSFILDSEATNRSGTGKLQAVLTRNGFTFGSWAIFCNIFENVIQDGATEDKNVIDVLTELKDEVTKAKPLADSLNANIPKAQPLVNSLNTQIPQATEIAREIESIIEEGGAVDKRDLGEYKKDFEGVEHDTLNSRLNRDFDNLHQRMNDSSLLAYEGTSIKADNTYLGLTKDTVIKGRTLQNLWGADKVVKTSYCKQEGEYIKIDCIEEIQYIPAVISIEDVTLKPNTQYTLITEVVENTIEATSENCKFYSNVGHDISAILGNTTPFLKGETGIKTDLLTTKENFGEEITVGVRTFLNFAKSGHLKFRIFILEGDHTQTPLEELPFIEGIESTGDKSKNLFDGETRNGYYSNGEFKANSSNLANVNPIEIKPNTYYTGSGDAPPRMSFYDKDMNFISYNSNSSTCLSPSNAKYMNIHGMGATYFQIEEGETATPYQEYYDGYKISGKSCGKNLFDGEWKIGNLNSNNGVFGDGGFMFINRYPIKIKPNTSYIFSTNQEDIVVHKIGYYNNGIFIRSETPNASPKKFNSGNSNECYVVLSYKDLSTGKVDYNVEVEKYFKNIVQLEEGTSLAPYEPYKESTYSYILNEPLRSLPNGVCDTIDLETGVLTRRVGKTVFNGGEAWSWHTTSEGGDYNVYWLPMGQYGRKLTGDNVILSKFTTKGAGDNVVSHFSFITSGMCYIRLVKPLAENIEELKELLRSEPITVYYELAEPTTEQLTPCQLKSFDTTTHIISDNKLMPIVSTKIPSDVNAVVQGLKAENVKLEKQLDSAIEELNNTDVDLIAIDWETDYRLCELEWTLLDTMKVETLAESKVVENRILSRYEQAKILIESGKYNKTTMEKQLTMYYNRNYLTKEEFNELMQLMNPIGEVETLEELDKVKNI